MSIVMKFGGTSVADAAALEKVARIVASEREAAPVVVVVSAMSGVTDALLAATDIDSLQEVFERHRRVSRELLDDNKAFAERLSRAEQEIAELLTEAGVTPMQAPRALLESGEEASSTRIQHCMQVVFERDPVAYGERNFELAYLVTADQQWNKS